MCALLCTDAPSERLGTKRTGYGAVVWRESVVIGETSMGAQEVQEVVQQLGSEYKGTAYHLLERNCNHFSNELCMKLTGNPAPSWVGASLSSLVLAVPSTALKAVSVCK